MKKIIAILIILLVLLNISTNKLIPTSAFAEKIDLNLQKDEIAITFININPLNYLLVSTKHSNLLLILNSINNNVENILNKFSINNLDLLMFNNINRIGIRYHEKTIFQNRYYLDKVEYYLDDNFFHIEYLDSNFCLYVDKGVKKSNVAACNFIYFYTSNNISSFSLNDKTDIVFYYYKRPLPSYLLYETYKKWIETYNVRDDEFTIIKLMKGDYEVIIVPDN